eukprot:433225_1
MCKKRNQLIFLIVVGIPILWNVYIDNDTIISNNINYTDISKNNSSINNISFSNATSNYTLQNNHINYTNTSNNSSTNITNTTTNYTIENNNINNTNTILNRRKYKDYDMVILQWTTIWGINTNISLTTICNISGTDKINQKILITDDNSLRPFAKALIFHGPDIKSFGTIKRTHKKHDDIYILWMQESPGCWPLIWQQRVLSYFNLLISYKLNADIPTPYLELHLFKTFIFGNNIHSFKEKDKTTADVLWIGSNCLAVNGREKYLKELFKYI